MELGLSDSPTGSRLRDNGLTVNTKVLDKCL